MSKAALLLPALFLTLTFAAGSAQAASVCLDPGHGGSDPGAVGHHCEESEANLAVALDARSYLQQVSGVSVGMTRTTDTYVSLADRVAYANSHGYERFMAIHHNAFDSTVQGTETFCYTSAGSTSVDLRNEVHGWLIWAHGYYDRGVKTANFYVLRETSMAATLGEASFIDYRGSYDESQRLCGDVDDHVGREGYAYAAGYCDHRSLTRPTYGGGTPAYDAHWVGQWYPSTMTAGENEIVWVEYMNDGSATWDVTNTRLGTTEPRDRSSAFYTDYNWFSASRPTAVDHTTPPGVVGRYTFIITAPSVSTPTTYTEHWGLLQEGQTWFGPPDAQVYFRITVNPVVEPDGDGDGYTPSEGDCDDSNPAVHPGAEELCHDGLDNDCDGDTDGQDGECRFTLDLDLSHGAGVLTMDYTIATSAPATWANFLIFPYPDVQIVHLWTIPLGVIDTPITLPVALPMPSAWWVGVYSGLFTDAGAETTVLEWIDTGS